MTGFWCKRVLCVFNVLSTNVKDDTAQICIVIMWFKDSVPDGNGFSLWHSFLFSSYWLLEKCPRCKAISPSPLAIWTFPLGYIPSSWPFFSLTFADTECTFPPCTSTAYGWGISLRSLRCCRSPRKSFSAWRPCSSLALVSTLLRAKNENIKKWTYRGVSTVRNEHDFFLSIFTSSRWGSEESEVLWRIASHLHQRTRPPHQLSNDYEHISEVLPAHTTHGLSPDGELVRCFFRLKTKILIPKRYIHTFVNVSKKPHLWMHGTWMHFCKFERKKMEKQCKEGAVIILH